MDLSISCRAACTLYPTPPRYSSSIRVLTPRLRHPAAPPSENDYRRCAHVQTFVDTCVGLFAKLILQVSTMAR